MKSVKEFMASTASMIASMIASVIASVIDRISAALNIDPCVSSMRSYQWLIEIAIIAALVLLFALPAIIW